MNRRRIQISAAVIFWAIVIWYAATFSISRNQFGILFVGGVLVVYILNEIFNAYEESNQIDMALLSVSGAITLGTTSYMYIMYDVLNEERIGYALTHEYIIAALFVAVIAYLAWREFGLNFLLVVVGGITYGFFGPYFPGILSHSGFSTERMLHIMVLDLDGVYGYLTRLVAAWIALFLLYSGLLRAYGAFELILRASLRSVKYVKSGVAQSAVIASMIIGSINGSQTANAGITGSFTIPTMKENGHSSETAGGIESVASTSGQVLPPIMGTGAFIMAALLGVHYFDVVYAGILPAIILCVTIAYAVHLTSVNELTAKQLTHTEIPIDERMSRNDVYLNIIKYVVPFLVLIYTLGIAQYTVTRSALYTCIAMVVLGIPITIYMESSSTDGYREQAVSTLDDTLEGFHFGAITLAPIAIVLAAINAIVDILLASGVPSAVSLAMFDLSGGIMLAAVILSMLIGLVLGLGMPTAAAYLVVAILIVPSLTRDFLVPEMAAHFFAFYVAILAGLTPPVAPTVAVAVGVAGANFWGGCKRALQISLPLFVLPFTFIYHPSIVTDPLSIQAITTTIIAIIGSLLIVYGLNHQSDIVSRGRMATYANRAVIVGLGVVIMIYPSIFIQGIAIIAALLLLFIHIGHDMVPNRIYSARRE